MTIIIDEFTCLIRQAPALTSVLQKMWDLHLSHRPNLRLVLTGSMVGMMEQDMVAASRRDKQLFIAEAKWGTRPVSRPVLTDLVKRSQRMPQVAQGWTVTYGLFARAGFTPATQAQAQQIGARLVDLDALEGALVDAVGRSSRPLPDEEIAF